MSIEIKYSSDDKELVNTLQKMQSGLDKTARKLDQVGAAGRRSARDASGEFGQLGKTVVSNVGQMVSALTGFGGVVQSLTQLVEALQSERQRVTKGQERSRLAGMEMGEVMREVFQTFRPDESVTRESLMGEFQRISEATGGTSLKDIAIAAKDVFSVGAKTNRQALDAMEAAFRVVPGKPGEATELAGRAIQLAKIQGTDNFKAVIGLMTNLAEATSVRDIPMLAATAPGSAAAALASGGTAEEGLEIFSTLQQLLGDVEGRRTATASETLIAKLNQFVPESAAEKKKGKPVRRGEAFVGGDDRGEFLIPDADIEAFEAAKGPQARIEMLRRSEGLRRAFLTEATFETRSETSVREFLAGSRRALEEEALLRPKIGGIATPEERDVQEKSFEEFVRNLNAAPFQQDVETSRRLQSTRERLNLGDELGRRIAQVRQTLFDEDIGAIPNIDQRGLEDFPILGRRGRQEREFEKRMRGLSSRFDETGRLEESVFDPEQHRFVKRRTSPEEIGADILGRIERDQADDLSRADMEEIRTLRQELEAAAEARRQETRLLDEQNKLMREQNTLQREQIEIQRRQGEKAASPGPDDRRPRPPASAQLGRNG